MLLNTISANLDDQHNCLTVLFNSTGQLMVKIINVNGQFIKTVTRSFQTDSSEFSLRLDDLSKGVYILNIFKDNSFIKSLQYNKY